jgi:hypothetical protein
MDADKRFVLSAFIAPPGGDLEIGVRHLIIIIEARTDGPQMKLRNAVTADCSDDRPLTGLCM